MEPSESLRPFDRAWVGTSISKFLDGACDELLGKLVAASGFAVELAQRDAWMREIEVLQSVLSGYRERGHVYLEFVVPRLGKRIDALNSQS